MDLKGKPTYIKEDCPECPKLKQKDTNGGSLCDHCHKPIPRYEEGRVLQGYQSQSVHHWHLRAVQGVTGYTVVKAALCLDCYKKDFAQVYPGHKLEM